MVYDYGAIARQAGQGEPGACSHHSNWRLFAACVVRNVTDAHAEAVQTEIDDRQEHQATNANPGLLESSPAFLEAVINAYFADVESSMTWGMIGLIVTSLKLIP